MCILNFVVNKTKTEKKKISFRASGVAQVVKGLPSKCDTLSSNFSAAKKTLQSK
jgi:hypothetical protein